jgi:hypothetical protein
MTARPTWLSSPQGDGSGCARCLAAVRLGRRFAVDGAVQAGVRVASLKLMLSDLDEISGFIRNIFSQARYIGKKFLSGLALTFITIWPIKTIVYCPCRLVRFGCRSLRPC